MFTILFKRLKMTIYSRRRDFMTVGWERRPGRLARMHTRSGGDGRRQLSLKEVHGLGVTLEW